MTTIASILRMLASLVALALLGGCAGFFTSGGPEHQRSSLTEYLYPGRTGHVDHPGFTRLSLPLKVGVAFVPEFGYGITELSRADKRKLIQQVSVEFELLPFVDSIELIPSAYLQHGGGFANLDQLRSMFDIDVIALLSYDQVQHTDQNLLSVTYWTVVGAYIFQGQENDTSTLVDAAVYDIPSRRRPARRIHHSPAATAVGAHAGAEDHSGAGRRSAAGQCLAVAGRAVRLPARRGVRRPAVAPSHGVAGAFFTQPPVLEPRGAADGRLHGRSAAQPRVWPNLPACAGATGPVAAAVATGCGSLRRSVGNGLRSGHLPVSASVVWRTSRPAVVAGHPRWSAGKDRTGGRSRHRAVRGARCQIVPTPARRPPDRRYLRGCGVCAPAPPACASTRGLRHTRWLELAQAPMTMTPYSCRGLVKLTSNFLRDMRCFVSSWADTVLGLRDTLLFTLIA